jgi:translation initiation factor 3 subunit D
MDAAAEAEANGASAANGGQGDKSAEATAAWRV